MDTVEIRLWKEIVSSHLAESPEAGLTKAKQQALAIALQQWTASCITKHLENIVEGQAEILPKNIKKEGWRINHNGRNFLGAIRWQEVDVWMSNDEGGLILAVDPKHFQSKDSLNKNWKNGHNDLTAFSTNLHERFPMCVVGGVISFPEWAATSLCVNYFPSLEEAKRTFEEISNDYGYAPGAINSSGYYDVSIWEWTEDRYEKIYYYS